MATSSQTPRKRALKAAKNKKPKVVFASIEAFKLYNIPVNYELLEVEPFEEKQSFLLRVINKKFGSKIINQFFETKEGENILNVLLDIEQKEVLLRFHFVDENIVFNREVESDAYEVNIKIGKLISEQKYTLLENSLDELFKNYRKGIKNENRVIDIVQKKLSNDYEIEENKKLDNAGVDFALVCKKTVQIFPFQVKSSWRSVKEAIRKGKNVYRFDSYEIPIIFIVVSRDLTDSSILNIIMALIGENRIQYN